MNKYVINCMSFIVLFTMSLNIYAGERTKKPPLPLHSIEGNGGILISGSAYLVNPAEKGKVFGLPSGGLTYANLGHGKHLEAITASVALWDRVELGYAFDHLDLGDLPMDISAALGVKNIEDSVYLHNFNARLQLVKEGDFGKSWMPALSLGIHYKYNNDTNVLDSRLSGALNKIGIKDNDGVDVTLHASKMITSLPRPLMLNAGIRSTEAATIGLLGFTDNRKIVFEGNFGILILHNLVIGAEYRQKPEEYDLIPGLIAEEEDWWDAFVTYIVNDNLTMSVATANFGDVLNDEANNTWGIKFKWEF